MTPRQNSLYWREWSLARAALITDFACTPAEAAARRHELHIRALGVDKSHSALTNAEFDKILAVFSSYSRSADLKAQLRLQDQPGNRLEAHRTRARKLCAEIGVEPHGLAAYLDHLARNICNRHEFDHCDEIETARLCGVLEVQAHRLRRRAARTHTVSAEPNPF